MKEQFIHQIENHVHTFFQVAKLTKKKWYKELRTFDELLYSFFVIRRRMIQSKHFMVHEAKSIAARDIKPEILREYAQLKNALINKGDLKTYHTENSKILFPIDGLLEDWNINHLHLNRSRYQVFFLQELNEIFVINICKHFEKNRTAYNKSHLLKTIEDNWPDKLLKNKNRHSNEKYPSAYGWRKVEELDAWLNDIVSTISQEAKISFIENESFVVQDLNSHRIEAGIASFEV